MVVGVVVVFFCAKGFTISLDFVPSAKGFTSMVGLVFAVVVVEFANGLSVLSLAVSGLISVSGLDSELVSVSVSTFVSVVVADAGSLAGSVVISIVSIVSVSVDGEFVVDDEVCAVSDVLGVDGDGGVDVTDEDANGLSRCTSFSSEEEALYVLMIVSLC